MKYFIDAEGQTFAFEPDDKDEFIARYAKPDWRPIDRLPERQKTSEELAREAAAAKHEADAIAAKADAKLSTLADMSPAQARAWVNDNVKTLADAKDVLATMAAAVSVLARRI